MPHGPFDDDAFDAVLRGSPHPDGDPASFASFVDDVHAAAEAVPIVPSTALAAALATGISPSAAEQQPTWRKWKMKIQGFLAGLSVAGKLALGVGVAAAATTGAGAAGVLPGPVQDAFLHVVHSVTPFDGDSHHEAGGGHDGDTTTTTTTFHDGDAPPTTIKDGEPVPPPPPGSGDSPTTTIQRHEGDGPTPTTVESTPPTSIEHHEGDGGDGGSGGETTTTLPTTTTTEHHDGDNNNPESLSLNCVRGREPTHITCTWSAATSPDHHRYVLLRVQAGGEHGVVVDSTEDGLTFTDTTVSLGVQYSYRVDSLRADNSVDSHSPLVTLYCCGDL
jgi:hypothetical protein